MESMVKSDGAEKTISTEVIAMLTIFSADEELRRKALPYVNLEKEEVDWYGIAQNDFGGGHCGAIAWAKAIWTGEVPSVNPFERAYAMGPNLRRAVLTALANRWGFEVRFRAV